MGNTNSLLTGVTYEEMKQYDVRTRGNFTFCTACRLPFAVFYRPRERNLTDIQNNNRSVKRNFKAFFIEDIWDITDNLRLTAGARYDDYSDFGDSFNPRVGLTWEFLKGYDLKLLYGSAFRAPCFNELYDILFNNPDLDPEEVDSYQVSVGAEFTPSFSSRVTWFRNDKEDYISWQTFPFRNRNCGKVRSEGVIVEMKYDFGRGSYLAMNHTYLTHKKEMFSIIPRYTGNIMANIRLSRYLNLYADCHIEDGFRRDRSLERSFREKFTSKRRDDMSGFAVVNATLIAKKFWKEYEELELRGSVYNLFDKDYTAPTGWGVDVLSNDLPMPGRNFMVEVKYKF
jgi:iron complex outermembrane receptor protein